MVLGVSKLYSLVKFIVLSLTTEVLQTEDGLEEYVSSIDVSPIGDHLDFGEEFGEF